MPSPRTMMEYALSKCGLPKAVVESLPPLPDHEWVKTFGPRNAIIGYGNDGKTIDNVPAGFSVKAIIQTRTLAYAVVEGESNGRVITRLQVLVESRDGNAMSLGPREWEVIRPK